jgi:hypothetical protein
LGVKNSALKVLDAHPLPTLVVDAGARVVYANTSAKRRFGVREGLKLGEALHCADAEADECGNGPRCSACAFRRATLAALAGTPSMERGFVLRGEHPGDPEDLHLLAFTSPVERDGTTYAVVAFADVNEILGDPGIVKVCEGCGKVQDEEGAWHPLHLYLEDRLGLETAGGLCDVCHDGGLVQVPEQPRKTPVPRPGVKSGR